MIYVEICNEAALDPATIGREPDLYLAAPWSTEAFDYVPARDDFMVFDGYLWRVTQRIWRKSNVGEVTCRVLVQRTVGAP